MKICSLEECTGCGLCFNVCANNAIKMEEDEFGFLRPQIAVELCRNCGLCQKLCPNNVSDISENFNLPKVYAAWNKDKRIRSQSTSGGVFSVLAKYVLKNGGVVAGVRWSDDFSAEHCIIKREQDLCVLYGSKYIQSETKDIYERIKIELESEKPVLFSGTPCQNHALRIYLKKEYLNLIQIDLVCHGVTSKKVLKRHLEELSGGNESVVDVSLRHKTPYWDYCDVKITFDDGVYSCPTVDDPFFTLFNVGYSLQKKCHNCKYTKLFRYSDITLADFWGFLPSDFKMRNYNKGVSLVLINSEKGKRIFEEIKCSLIFQERSIEEAKKSNKSLSESYVVPEDKEKLFWDDLSSGIPLDQLVQKYILQRIRKPGMLCLRRLKNKYRWVFSKK